jgi:molybdopterin-containing oxidoreductase family membrane subunit
LGTASYLLVLVVAFHGSGQVLDMVLARKLSKLLGWFVLAVLAIVAVHHLSNIYVARHHGVERFILLDGGVYPVLFWGVQIFLGSLVPVILLLLRRRVTLRALVLSASLVVAGGLAQIYNIIIGGQAYPLSIFPGYEVESGGFFHETATYLPSLPELGLGFGGLAFALLLTVFGLRVLPFLPVRRGQSLKAG